MLHNTCYYIVKYRLVSDRFSNGFTPVNLELEEDIFWRKTIVEFQGIHYWGTKKPDIFAINSSFLNCCYISLNFMRTFINSHAAFTQEIISDIVVLEVLLVLQNEKVTTFLRQALIVSFQPILPPRYYFNNSQLTTSLQ